MFSKIHETEIGQICVIIQEVVDGDCMEVRYFFKPDGLGVCSMALSFDGDNAEEKAQNCFDKSSPDVSVSMVNRVMHLAYPN